MSERHEAKAHTISAADQQAVFDLMKERLFELFGPGGSFKVTLGRANADDAVFVSTLAETIAWDVAATLEVGAEQPAQHVVDVHAADPIPEHEQFWAHIEAELLRQRNGDQSLTVIRTAA